MSPGCASRVSLSPAWPETSLSIVSVGSVTVTVAVLVRAGVGERARAPGRVAGVPSTSVWFECTAAVFCSVSPRRTGVFSGS